MATFDKLEAEVVVPKKKNLSSTKSDRIQNSNNNMTSVISRTLEVFRYQVAHQLTIKQLWRGVGGIWSYPPMTEANLEEVETYVDRLQNTVAQ